MKKVDQIITAKIGLSVHDLSDFLSRDMYDAGDPPIDAAWEALDCSDMREIADGLYEDN
jgi:hypothetical protein